LVGRACRLAFHRRLDHLVTPGPVGLLDRYPRAERAKGFLIARGIETADDEGALDGEPEQGTLLARRP